MGVCAGGGDAGNTVIVVEHNLGPEGGAAGGRVMAEGTPEEAAQVSGSHTGACLRGML